MLTAALIGWLVFAAVIVLLVVAAVWFAQRPPAGPKPSLWVGDEDDYEDMGLGPGARH